MWNRTDHKRGSSIPFLFLVESILYIHCAASSIEEHLSHIEPALIFLFSLPAPMHEEKRSWAANFFNPVGSTYRSRPLVSITGRNLTYDMETGVVLYMP